MLRRIISSLALVAIVSAPVAAQQLKFKAHNGGSPTYNHLEGQFTQGTLPATGNFSLNTPFQIWCVDLEHSFTDNSQYNVNVSRLDGDLSNTRKGNVALYTKAAWLASDMTDANTSVNQNAIWAIIHGKTMCSELTAGGLSCNNASLSTKMAEAHAKYTGMDTGSWYVITDKNKNGANSAQEFIAHCQEGTGQIRARAVVLEPCTPDWDEPDAVPTPEPATMSLLAMGLAGLAGSSLRRRKK